MPLFGVPESFIGKTLEDIYNLGQGGGRRDIIANQLGIAENVPFREGQTFNTTYFDPGSAEGQYLSRTFVPENIVRENQARKAQQQATSSALESAKQLRQFNIESTQPQVSQLETGTKNLQSKYAEILASIKGTEQAATEKSTLNVANELARRGITGGGFYDIQTSNAALDIARQFAPQRAEVGLKEAEAVNQINNAIAALRSGDPQAAIQAAMTLSNLGQQASQFQQTFGLQQQQQQQQTDYQNRALQQAMEIAKLQNQPKEADFTKNFATLGEGQTLFNLLTGKSIFTNPKTYKQTVDDTGDSNQYYNSSFGRYSLLP